ncbi:MAG: hypothetical protein HUU41_21965 [Bryobacteraceae bacterium]|nr:hypothetical protein [Bryobacteraceae bacterium]
MTITEKKSKFAAELVKKNKSITKSAVAKAIDKKFGSEMDPRKLREVFIAAGGTVQKRSPAMVKAHKAAMKQRKATRTSGRRSEDKSREKLESGMKAAGEFVVVVVTNGVPVAHPFKNRGAAHKYIETQLDKGMDRAAIAFYAREEVKVPVKV